MEVAAAPLRADLDDEFFQLAGDMLDHRLESGVGNFEAAEFLGEGDDAKLQRNPEADAFAQRGVGGEGAIGAGPAGRARRFRTSRRRYRIKRRWRRRRRKARPSPRRRDAPLFRGRRSQGRGRSPVSPFQEFGAVLRRPAGFGGDEAGARHAPRIDLAAANGERFDGALDRRRAEARPVRERPSPSRTMREKESDDAKSRASPSAAARDQQPAIVCAKIKRRINAILDQFAARLSRDAADCAAALASRAVAVRPRYADPALFGWNGRAGKTGGRFRAKAGGGRIRTFQWSHFALANFSGRRDSTARLQCNNRLIKRQGAVKRHKDAAVRGGRRRALAGVRGDFLRPALPAVLRRASAPEAAAQGAGPPEAAAKADARPVGAATEPAPAVAAAKGPAPPQVAAWAPAAAARPEVWAPPTAPGAAPARRKPAQAAATTVRASPAESARLAVWAKPAAPGAPGAGATGQGQPAQGQSKAARTCPPAPQPEGPLRWRPARARPAEPGASWSLAATHGLARRRQTEWPAPRAGWPPARALQLASAETRKPAQAA